MGEYENNIRGRSILQQCRKIHCSTQDNSYQKSEEIDSKSNETEDQCLAKNIQPMLEGGVALFYAQLTVGEEAYRSILVVEPGTTGEYGICQSDKEKRIY
jgi:hypothetical protein